MNRAVCLSFAILLVSGSRDVRGQEPGPIKAIFPHGNNFPARRFENTLRMLPDALKAWDEVAKGDVRHKWEILDQYDWLKSENSEWKEPLPHGDFDGRRGFGESCEATHGRHVRS